jgi:HEPN domain-containing protein
MSSDFKQIALERLTDAEVLLGLGRYAGAYYLTGYSVECALKAIIAKQTRRHEFPNKKRINDSWTHDISKLFVTSELDVKQASSQTQQYLATVNRWNTESRYKSRISRNEAEDLFEAVTDPQDGVLSWLKTYW